MRKQQSSEREIQRTIIAMVQLCFPRVIVHHSPNQNNKRGWAGKIAAVNNRLDGVVTGWPDLIFIAPQFVAFAEVKARSERPTERQQMMLDKLSDYGFAATFVRTPEAAYAWLREVGAPWNGVEFVPERHAA